MQTYQRILLGVTLLAALLGFAALITTGSDADAEIQTPPEPVKTVASLQRSELMAEIFPEGRDVEGGRLVELELPERDNKAEPIFGSEYSREVIVSPRHVVRLDDQHAVMVTETAESFEGKPEDSHASGAWLGAYFFNRSADGWTLASQVNGFDYLGSNGNAGKTDIRRIGAKRFVLTVESGGCWQGYCGNWLHIYELKADGVKRLAAGLPLEASSVGANGGCDDQWGKFKLVDGAVGDSCFDIEGKYAIALGNDETPGEIRIVFHGQASDDRKRVKAVLETAIYRYDGKSYRLISGRNPAESRF